MRKICYVVTIPDTIKAFFVEQIRYLSKNGYDVFVICSSDSELRSELGEDIHFLPVNIPRGISIVGSVSAIKSLYKIFKKEHFSLVQYSTPNAALYAAIAASVLHVPVRNYHLMGLRYLSEVGIKKHILYLIEKITCALSTHIECVSKSNLKLGIADKLFSEEKATVVWNGSTGGINLQKFNNSMHDAYRIEIRNKLGIEKNTLVYGFVGRINRDKGVAELFSAFFSHERNAVLMLIGNVEDKSILDAPLVIEGIREGRIKMVNFVNDIEKYYCAMDVLVLPSYREGFGNVVIEAAAMGTPAIVSRIPGPIDATIENETALVVPPKDIESLSKAMDKLADSALRQEMGEHAIEYSKNSFDSVQLCKEIKHRKDMLLNTQ